MRLPNDTAVLTIITKYYLVISAATSNSWQTQTYNK